MKIPSPNSRSFLDRLFDKPWILIILGFLVLVSVWVFFFIAAARNQPTIILEQSSLQSYDPVVMLGEHNPRKGS
ncbi:MAG: hypothetical protein JJT75_06365 [Opitutales bacterium]|nr:hypothetical protein [Opitutales bacterium]MCH8541280.1 hypothetical protein [Opitutales bacterium]